ncbi:MAG: DUF885 family protein [Woeseiaceae bacterium]
MNKLCLFLLLTPCSLLAQDADIVLPEGWGDDPPDLSSLVIFARGESDLRVAVVRYLEDKAAIERRYEVRFSPVRIGRLTEFYLGWQAKVKDLSFGDLNHEGQVDYIALRNRVEYDLETLRLEEERGQQIAPLLPFSDSLRLLQEERHDRKRVHPRTAAGTLNSVANELGDLTDNIAAGDTDRWEDLSRVVASRAANQVQHLREVLADWNTFYDGYDPMFNFWVPEPYARVDAALEIYAKTINEHLVGISEEERAPIIGDPVLEQGLRADLAVEMIPYSAEELIRIGEREFEWIEDQFRIVANDMGFGDDWLAALEHTKNLAPPPGEKPWRIFNIADYSENFIEGLDNITLPGLSREIWRLKMQTPEAQLVNPFFTGGEVTRVSFPTSGMAHEDKMMSMRGNTPHFNFGTVQHELVPGHHMQGFMSNRFNQHRGQLNRTPFWGEGWALYWEFLLWETDFPRNDPDKIGMLFWRLHRAARIIFSLNYHLGNWTPEQAVDFLVERVGHERANAEAEVRRTARDAPLYQIAYMIGALQFRKLYEEVVKSGDMTAREFHDAVMQGGRLPVELVRARLTGQQLTSDFQSQWHFYGNP